MENEWISVEDLPENGDYEVRIITKNLNVIASIRRLINGQWFGGCRPFTDGQTVTHWRQVQSTKGVK